jgi:dephospho-CoA kinase
VTRVVALTGSVAAGKSTVAGFFREWGATIIDADQIVRELQEPGQEVLAKIVVAFGAEILRADGTLDRATLRRQVLADPAARARLERIVHPAVEVRRRDLVARARMHGVPLVIADIPLLFEAGHSSAYDGVIVVDAPIALRKRRLMELRHLSDDDADRLIASQLPAAVKRSRATWLIENDLDPGTLRDRTRAVWYLLPR